MIRRITEKHYKVSININNQWNLSNSNEGFCNFLALIWLLRDKLKKNLSLFESIIIRKKMLDSTIL